MDTLSATRKLHRSAWANTGFLPTFKVTNGVVAYESRVERDFYLLLDHCPSVEQFQHQPLTITWKDKNGKERKYTPDVLVILKDGTRKLIEIKKEEDLEALVKEYRDAWIAASIYANANGMEFGVVTDKHIRTPRHSNIWFLRGASRLNLGIKSPEIATLIKILRQFKDGTSYGSLCKELAGILGVDLTSSARIVGYAIYHGIVLMDAFSAQCLSQGTIIKEKSSGIDTFTPIFNDLLPYPIDRLVHGSLIERGSSLRPQASVLLDIDEKYREEVKRREEIIKEWMNLVARKASSEDMTKFLTRAGITSRSIYYWEKRYEEGGIKALVPRYARSGRYSPIEGGVQELMDEFREQFYTKKISTIKGVFSQLVQKCEDNGLDPPSYSTFQRYVSKVSKSKMVRSKEGYEAWKRLFQPEIDSFKDGTMPMQVLEIDNTPFDVFPVDTECREALRTPNLVAAIDVYSHMITGFYLTYDHPSRLTVLEVLVMSMLPKDDKTNWRQTSNPWPIQGLPVMILVDNGMDYRANDVREFCKTWGIILEYAPVHKPEYKGFIEQWFEILKKSLRNEDVPGFRPPLRLRKDDREFNPERNAALTLIELERWLISWIVDGYHERLQQKDLVMSPLMKLFEAIRGQTSFPYPAPVMLSPETTAIVRLHALNRKKGKISKRGITFLYQHYHSTELQALFREIGRKRVEYFIDPRDIRYIYVINPRTKKVFQVGAVGNWKKLMVEAAGNNPLSLSSWKLFLSERRESLRRKNAKHVIKQAELSRSLESGLATQVTKKTRKSRKTQRMEVELLEEHSRKAISSDVNFPIGKSIPISTEYNPVEAKNEIPEKRDDYVPKMNEFELF